MKRVMEQRAGCIVLVEYLHELPEPLPTPISGNRLEALGMRREGSRYTSSEHIITYDGCDWWIGEGFMRIHSMEEVKQLLKL